MTISANFLVFFIISLQNFLDTNIFSAGIQDFFSGLLGNTDSSDPGFEFRNYFETYESAYERNEYENESIIIRHSNTIHFISFVLHLIGQLSVIGVQLYTQPTSNPTNEVYPTI